VTNPKYRGPGEATSRVGSAHKLLNHRLSRRLVLERTAERRDELRKGSGWKDGAIVHAVEKRAGELTRARQ
jgi:hypothetical protein